MRGIAVIETGNGLAFVAVVETPMNHRQSTDIVERVTAEMLIVDAHSVAKDVAADKGLEVVGPNLDT
ncbi:hypothetical protein HAP94_08380 [Acidithiobacillus ferrivorans]|nr:hypothetical protein [Acidithiobacillus ferrivorans]